MKTNKYYDEAVDEIIKLVKERNISNKNELYNVKKEVCQKYNIPNIISDSALVLKSGMQVFSRKLSRRLSGVTVIAVMTSPAKCPHGKCVFCPGGVEFMTPQSYTGREPAALRGAMNDYDAYSQVKSRLSQYKSLGQTPSKIDLIIMGGTFTHRTYSYQEKFITDCLRALNNKKNGGLKAMQELNEHAFSRCVGLTIETRPDEINKKTVSRLLKLGVTRVELGVQSVDNNVLSKSNRGHTVGDVVRATKMLKDAGFKINYHMMTNMPGSTIKKDLESFTTVFEDNRFKPDMVKIYPTLLIKGTKLYDMYLRKEWMPYSLNDTIKIIARIKRLIPPYVRVMRIQRDIPSYLIEQDLKNSNLRELVKDYMNREGWFCRCIRCREAGRNNGEIAKAHIKKIKYEASLGTEYFIEYVDEKEVLFGFLRLRIMKDKCFVRELHVYGEQVPVGGEPVIQHTGIGRLLMSTAEGIVRKNKLSKLHVISGVGVRGYYRKLGYYLENNYMVKKL
ncbi:Uncharacterised protein [Candidatus Tiddalikarchaeum anstoanum]|nr:Uncharacterised protein [Candidatus Tiddalikarchaeum anstoanum]